MRRHLLLTALRRRQRLLALRPASPLRRSLERHRALAAALGLTALAADDRPQQPLATGQPLWSPRLLAARQPIGEAPPLVSPLPEEGEQAPAAPWPWPPEQLTPTETIPAPAAGEDQPRAAATADEEELAAPPRPDENQRQEAGPLTSPPLPATPPVGHARVIELGAASTPYDTIALDAPESDLARIGQSLPASPGSTSDSEVAAAPELPNEAAQLFRPRLDEAERSPQSWLRRLVEQAQREQRQPAQRQPAKGAEPDQEPDRMTGPARPAGAASAFQANTQAPAQPSLPPLTAGLQRERPAAAAATQRSSSSPAGGPRNAEPPALIARRFLKPLVGIDLAEVALYRDARAARATAAHAAEALSDADTIELAPQEEQTTPEGLGLLAHELTHIMRRRRPRFLPPIIRPAPMSEAGEPAEPAPAIPLADEEQVALAVERRVRQQARTAFAVTASPVPPAPMTATEPSTLNAGRTPEGEDANQGERGIWGNLPAPWEPLPAWLTAPASSGSPPASETTSGASLSSAPLAPPPPAFTPNQPLPVSANGSALPEEQSGSSRAGVERSLATPVGDQGEGQSAMPAARPPEPDLDALARQVYTLLKRRLSAEQRRLLS
ncbi:hypothetical protein KTAU_27330 [Thermogemmatispora aurantia]|uniref:eCIS core domain-containing protein n=1 Tax=Thermogemmatispora aurantia TaxID=2045279 RepID=UPI00124D4F9F|nr:DUF4157 domain-containing protein [Thermogemmatispora aurantia]GER84096.1 hypothetical protein KTAU_27330 [Thermogemmatispora aurantia]